MIRAARWRSTNVPVRFTLHLRRTPATSSLPVLFLSPTSYLDSLISSTTGICSEQKAKYRFLSHLLQRRRYSWQGLPFKRGLSTEYSSNLDCSKKENVVDIPTKCKKKPQLVYESPLGNVVSKLRTVSLMTAVIGMTGVPCMIALKGAIPEGGILAAAMLFVTGSVGSTAAIHFVFSPYVYRIEHIYIRQCSTAVSSEKNIDSLQSDNSSESLLSQKDTLLKAWTRSLFLFDTTIVFDPCVDVQPYKGMRPMCNLLAKGRPLYVHPGML